MSYSNYNDGVDLNPLTKIDLINYKFMKKGWREPLIETNFKINLKINNELKFFLLFCF